MFLRIVSRLEVVLNPGAFTPHDLGKNLCVSVQIPENRGAPSRANGTGSIPSLCECWLHYPSSFRVVFLQSFFKWVHLSGISGLLETDLLQIFQVLCFLLSPLGMLCPMDLNCPALPGFSAVSQWYLDPLSCIMAWRFSHDGITGLTSLCSISQISSAV